MGRINKSISLSNEAMEYAISQAAALFGGNISGYINFLVMREKNKITLEVEQPKEKKSSSKGKNILEKTGWKE